MPQTGQLAKAAVVRSQRLTLRLTPKEKRRIVQMARAHKQGESDWVRLALAIACSNSRDPACAVCGHPHSAHVTSKDHGDNVCTECPNARDMSWLHDFERIA